MGDDLRLRQCPAQFQQASAHVVSGSNQPQESELPRIDPRGRFTVVSAGAGCPVAQYNARPQLFGRATCNKVNFSTYRLTPEMNRTGAAPVLSRRVPWDTRPDPSVGTTMASVLAHAPAGVCGIVKPNQTTPTIQNMTGAPRTARAQRRPRTITQPVFVAAR